MFIIDRDIFLSTITHQLKLESWMNELSYLIYILIKLLLLITLNMTLTIKYSQHIYPEQILVSGL